MPVTISLKDSLASRVLALASAHNESPEEFVNRVLTDELDRRDNSPEWQALNQRRLALIEKRFRGAGLTCEEDKELERLQTAANRWFEGQDHQLLEELRRFRQTVEGLPNPARS